MSRLLAFATAYAEGYEKTKKKESRDYHITGIVKKEEHILNFFCSTCGYRLRRRPSDHRPCPCCEKDPFLEATATEEILKVLPPQKYNMDTLLIPALNTKHHEMDLKVQDSCKREWSVKMTREHNSVKVMLSCSIDLRCSFAFGSEFNDQIIFTANEPMEVGYVQLGKTTLIKIFTEDADSRSSSPEPANSEATTVETKVL